MNSIWKQATAYLLERREHRHWLYVFLCLAALVSLGTVTMLRYTGVALTNPPAVLECPYADQVVAHTHNEDCYNENGELVCPLEERPLHIHDASCYTTEEHLICGLEESDGHVHTDGCYETVRGDLLCEEEHEHTEDCYEHESILVCGLEEGAGAHVHNDECYEYTETLNCGQDEVTEEHVHGPACFRYETLFSDAPSEEAEEPEEELSDEAEADLSADVESSSYWRSMFADLELTGNWDEDLLAVANTQVGYRESGRNFIIDDNGDRKGYTRYGAWYGIPYGDWCAMFVSFCLNYADIPEKEMPRGSGVPSWAGELQQRGLFAYAGDYTPQPGDLIFFSQNGTAADHVGLVDDCWQSQTGAWYVSTIEGNYSNAVSRMTYELDDDSILGFGCLPQNPMPPQSFSAVLDDINVTVQAGSGAFPAGTTMVVTPVEADDVMEGVSGAVDGEIVAVQAVDIAFFSPEGEELEPARAIRVAMTPVEQPENASAPAVVHVDAEGEAALVEAEQSEEEITFLADSFSVYALVYTVDIPLEGGDYAYTIQGDSGLLYEVKVSYGDEAQLPEGAQLRVTEFEIGSEEYENARKAVLADHLARGEAVDPGTMGLAALDISILDADGNEIEPADTVRVDMKIKALPGVEDLSEIADSLVVKHHVETKDGVVLEAVYNGGTKARFSMDTDEAIAAVGTVVDPEAPEVAELAAEAYPVEAVVAAETAVSMVDFVEEPRVYATFEIDAFSTFTVEWGGMSTASVVGADAGRYVIYARDAVDGKYYALLPGNPLRTVEIQVENGRVIYSGSQNLYWTLDRPDVTINYSTGPETLSGYRFYYTSGYNNNTKNYLTWSESNGLYVTTTQYGYHHWNGWSYDPTGTWLQWYGHLYSNADCFLRSENGTFKVVNVTGDSNWEQKSQVFLAKDVTPGSINVIFEDGNGTELTVTNGQPVADASPAYLIYDIDGYEYDYTYLNNDKNNKITPILNMGGKWQYTKGTDWSGNVDWVDLNNNDVIHVVYKPKAEGTTGGVPKPKEAWTKPDQPTITKSSEANGDGTNTIALSVTAPTKPIETVKLADVVVVLDVSGSMRSNMSGQWADGVEGRAWVPASEQRISVAQQALYELSDMLLTQKNTAEHPDLIRMSLITFSNVANGVVQEYTYSADVFDGKVRNITEVTGGTNWEDALRLANLQETDPDRATFVIFVTDGEPTFRQTRGVLSNGNGTNGLADNDVTPYYYRFNVYGQGNSDDYSRNYAAALKEARAIVGSNKGFYTIGISNDVGNLKQFTMDAGVSEDHSFTAATEQDLINAFQDIGASILATAGYSSLTITDGITALTQTVEKTGMTTLPTEDDFVYSKERLATAEEIADTSLIPTGAVLDVRDGTSYIVWNNWDPTSEGAQKASFVKAPDYDTTKKGAVVWNMGDHFMPEDGYTYTVRFKVWPSQEAYDILARLNNGTLAIDELDTSVQAQIGDNGNGTYYLKTNEPTAGYSYMEATKAGDVVTPAGDPVTGTFAPVVNLVLVSDPLEIQKTWRTSMVSVNPKPKSIELDLLSMDDDTDTRTYKTVKLSEDNGWYSQENYVSYGLVKKSSSSLIVYESGHDFTLEEKYDQKKPEDLLAAHYWSFDPGVYRPMVVGEGSTTKKTVLERITDPAGVPPAFTGESPMFWHDTGGASESNPLFAANMRPTYTSGYTGDYYWLPDANGDYHAYIDTGSNVILLAINKQRSYVDLVKEVDDVDSCDEYFTFTGVIHVNTEGMTQAEIDVNREDLVWASVYGPSGRITPAQYEEISIDQFYKPTEIMRDYTNAYDGSFRLVKTDVPFTFKIKNGWSVRFLNLPNGSTVEFTENTIPDGYEFNNADLTVKRVDERTGSIVTETLTPTTYVADDAKLEATVLEADAGYTITYHNGPQVEKKELTVTKTWSDAATVNHASDRITFTVYQKAIAADGTTVVREQPYTGSYTNTITGTGQVTVSDLPVEGRVDGQNVTFEYYVVETGYSVGNGITYTPVVTLDDSGENDAWSITNIAPDSQDRPTSVTFTKVWKGAGDTAPAASHDGDTIQVKLIQKASAYVPVTVKLVNGYNTLQSTSVYYVPEGSTVTFTATRPGNSSHSLTVNGSTVQNSGNTFTYSIQNVSSATTIEAKLTYYSSRTRYDRWGDPANAGNNYYTWLWPTINVSSGIITQSVDDVIADAANHTPVATQEYLYTLGKDQLSDGPFNESASGWTATVDGLPLFKKISNDLYYAYYYTIEEISVNGVMVGDRQTDAQGNMTGGQMPGYSVSVDQSTRTITNTEKKLPLDILKVDANDMLTPLSGAEFTIQRIYENSTSLSLQGEPIPAAPTDANGKTGFSDLAIGYYIVKETKLPPGYIQTGSGSFYVRVGADGVKLVEWNGSGWTEIDQADKLVFTSATGTTAALATVGNEAGHELPASGGSGFRAVDPALLAGLELGLMALAGYGLMRRVRRRFAGRGEAPANRATPPPRGGDPPL